MNSSVCALLTCFNRREATLACLAKLEHSAKLARVRLSAILVDDGCTDGTSDAVRASFSWVEIVRTDGSLFWNQGMHLAMKRQMEKGDADFLLWLNDDTNLVDDAIARLLGTSKYILDRYKCLGVAIGATCDPETGRFTYGGKVQASRLLPFTFLSVAPGDSPKPCTTMNGNIVLIPKAIAQDVGNLDPVFGHSMGDLDYGLRATQRGHPIFVAPGFVGTCCRNLDAGTHKDASLSLRKRWQRITSRKELPFSSWLRFTYRHGGPLWPIYFSWPYLRVVLSGSASAKQPKA